MLAQEQDTPALRRAAGYSRRDDPRGIRQELSRALQELGAWLPGRGDWRLARAAQRRPGDHRCSRRAPGIWDFDVVTDSGLPGDLRDQVLMCSLLGTGHYAPSGGDEGLLGVARALAANSR
jgi:hypothetical protein